jgi:adenosine deaminase
MATTTLFSLASLPKIELHAHLNGSVRDATLRELLAADSAAGTDVDARRHAMTLDSLNASTRTLSDCFVISTPFTASPRRLPPLSA